MLEKKGCRNTFQWIQNPTNQARLSNHKVNAGCTVEVLHRSYGRKSADFQYVNWLEILPSQICFCQNRSDTDLLLLCSFHTEYT